MVGNSSKASSRQILLTLGAKFAYEEYIRPSLCGKQESSKLQKGCLLLETPCTHLDILQMFFARARIHGIPVDFSQTPLGLLVSEDDGPERRLRPGFRDCENVREALDLLLELEPGYEDVVMWSAVRHDHIEIVTYLLEDLGWNVEIRWKGLTNLHTAIAYGRTELVQYLLAKGADAIVHTEHRQLVCLHLLMLVPRHPQADHEIFDFFAHTGFSVNARERVDSLTAFHLAARNQKLQLIEQLLDIGADPSVPVTDQLFLLSQGKCGYLQRALGRPQIFAENLIVGEVPLQYSQDDFYSYNYASDLLFLLLDRLLSPLSEADLVVDKELNIAILHLLSTLPPHSGYPHIAHRGTNSF